MKSVFYILRTDIAKGFLNYYFALQKGLLPLVRRSSIVSESSRRHNAHAGNTPSVFPTPQLLQFDGFKADIGDVMATLVRITSAQHLFLELLLKTKLY